MTYRRFSVIFTFAYFVLRKTFIHLYLLPQKRPRGATE